MWLDAEKISEWAYWSNHYNIQLNEKTNENEWLWNYCKNKNMNEYEIIRKK